MDITSIRRNNAISLFQTYAEAQIAGGTPPKGLEQEFARSIEISPSMWSQIKSSRPIGNKLARQIEIHCKKATGWLDEEREPQGLTAGEQQFIAVALSAFRNTNSAGRKKLRDLLKNCQS